MPNFIAPHLHINEAIATYLEKGATPIPGIDTDIDGDTRHSITPDIGADEFNGIVVPVELTSFTATSNGREVLLSWSTAIGEVVTMLVNEEKESGYHTVEFNAASLPSGVYSLAPGVMTRGFLF
jgi:hypothetical protein